MKPFGSTVPAGVRFNALELMKEPTVAEAALRR